MRRYALLLLALAWACSGKGDRAPIQSDSGQSQASAGMDGRPSATAAEPKSILFLGTSLTAGLGLDPEDAYPMLIQRKLDSAGMPFQVINAGVSGETSAGLLRRLDWLLQRPLDVVVIETGANDGLRGVPVETMVSNLQRIIGRIRDAQPRTVIALVQMEAMPNMGSAYTVAFHDAFPELARRNNIPLLPFILDGVAGNRDLNQGDGMHPNEAGERIVAENVWRALKPLLR